MSIHNSRPYATNVRSAHGAADPVGDSKQDEMQKKEEDNGALCYRLQQFPSPPIYEMAKMARQRARYHE